VKRSLRRVHDPADKMRMPKKTHMAQPLR
jgi:hypothetical protein